MSLIYRVVDTRGWACQLRLSCLLIKIAYFVFISYYIEPRQALLPGTPMDWAKKSGGVKWAFSVDMRPGKGGWEAFVPPVTEIQPAAEELFAAVMTVAKRVQQVAENN